MQPKILDQWERPILPPPQQQPKATAKQLMVIGAVLVCALAIVVCLSWNPGSPEEIVESLTRPTQPVHFVSVRGTIVRVGDSFDSVVEVLRPTDRLSAPAVSQDPDLPGSLIVLHEYAVDGRRIRLEAKRRSPDGPYVVSRLWN